MITVGARLLDNEDARSVPSLKGLLCKRPGNSDHGQSKLAGRVVYWTPSRICRSTSQSSIAMWWLVGKRILEPYPTDSRDCRTSGVDPVIARRTHFSIPLTPPPQHRFRLWSGFDQRWDCRSGTGRRSVPLERTPALKYSAVAAVIAVASIGRNAPCAKAGGGEASKGENVLSWCHDFHLPSQLL